MPSKAFAFLALPLAFLRDGILNLVVLNRCICLVVLDETGLFLDEERRVNGLCRTINVGLSVQLKRQRLYALAVTDSCRYVYTDESITRLYQSNEAEIVEW